MRALRGAASRLEQMPAGDELQKHLEAGNPLYLGVNNHAEDAASVSLQPFPKTKRPRKWRRVLTFGMPLDEAVKTILTLGMLLAALQVLSGTDLLIQSMLFGHLFSKLLPAIQIVWGFFFFASCLFGFSVLWGSHRRSPTTTLIFTITWVFTTCFVLVTAVTWYYFFTSTRATHIAACRTRTVPVSLAPSAPRHQANPKQIAACVAAVERGSLMLLAPGVIYTVMIYAGAVVVVWGKKHRERLIEIRKWEEVQRMVRAGREGDEVALIRVGEGSEGSEADSVPVTPQLPEVLPRVPEAARERTRPATAMTLGAARVSRGPPSVRTTWSEQLGNHGNGSAFFSEGYQSHSASATTIARVL